MGLNAFNLAAQGAAITTQGVAFLRPRMILPKNRFRFRISPGWAFSGDDALAHNPGDAARLMPRRGDPLFQEAACGRAKITRPHIGPGAAAVLLLAGGLAGRPLRISADIHVAKV